MYTKLAAINAMVGATGTRPLTAQQHDHPMYQKAEHTLQNKATDFQSMGLWFNTEVRVLQPQANGELIVPQDCIRADPADRHINLTLRNGKLYDLDTGTYEINRAVRCRMVMRIRWEDMPAAAQSYVVASAVYQFYLDEDGTDPKLTHYRSIMNKAWETLYREHLINKQTTAFDNPAHPRNRLRTGQHGGRLMLWH